MEPVTTTIHHGRRKGAAITALAVVGFITLVFIGIALAIYAARYIPTAVSRVGSAAVYLSEVLIPGNDNNELEVVPGDTFPIEEGETIATSTEPVATTTPGTGTGVTPTPGQETTTVVQVPVTVPVSPYGKSDLVATITGVGYCTSSDTGSFRTASRVPDGERGGVRFVIRNAGTNVTGAWEFEVELPTSPSYTYDSARQSSLNPNDSKVFTLCFDRPRDGDRSIRVTVDQDDDVDESNENNNSDSKSIEIED